MVRKSRILHMIDITYAVTIILFDIQRLQILITITCYGKDILHMFLRRGMQSREMRTVLYECYTNIYVQV